MALMNKEILEGSDIFSEMAARNSDNSFRYLFVDKTLFIKEFIDHAAKVILITRPRKWGKSLNMSMLQHFLAPEVKGKSTRGMFDGLNITTIADSKYMAYQGQCPVIFISLKDIASDSFEETKGKFRNRVSALYRAHKSILVSNKFDEDDRTRFNNYKKGAIPNEELTTSLQDLCEFLYIYRSFQ